MTSVFAVMFYDELSNLCRCQKNFGNFFEPKDICLLSGGGVQVSFAFYHGGRCPLLFTREAGVLCSLPLWHLVADGGYISLEFTPTKPVLCDLNSSLCFYCNQLNIYNYIVWSWTVCCPGGRGPLIFSLPSSIKFPHIKPEDIGLLSAARGAGDRSPLDFALCPLVVVGAIRFM